MYATQISIEDLGPLEINSVLVVRTSLGVDDQMKLAKLICDGLKERKRRDVCVVFLPEGTDMTKLSVEQMEKVGWMKKP